MAGAWYRGRAELRRRWPALLVVGVLVGVVGGVTSAAVAGARRTASSYDRFRSETNADDAFLQATGIDERAVQEFLALPQVASWCR
ncbi:MAG: hypothetical protein K0R11_2174, partial [Acidimicrobiales bacterium]|nr:hypothetical protein [Acidimicrobiales bacterium]